LYVIYSILNGFKIYWWISYLESKLALMLVSLSWGINAFASFKSSFLNTFIPINFLRKILNVINLLLLLHSAVRVEKQRFVEWFWLIISVPVLSSNNVGVHVTFSFPWSLIKQLSISLKTTGNCTSSISFVKLVIKFAISNIKSLISIWLSSVSWV